MNSTAPRMGLANEAAASVEPDEDGGAGGPAGAATRMSVTMSLCQVGMLKMLRRMSDRLGVPGESVDASRVEQLAADTNVFDLIQTIREERPQSESASDQDR